MAKDKTDTVEVVLEDREVRTLVEKREYQIIRENGNDHFPQIVKDIATKHYTIQIRIKEMNVVDNIHVYSATNICNGFVMPPEVNMHEMETTSSQVRNLLTLYYHFS